MIKKFAIEPESLKSWSDFRYVMEKMSFSQGRVVISYPKKWARRLLDSLDNVSDIERARFVAKLQRYKEDRIVTAGLPYDPDLHWLRNVQNVSDQAFSDAILISEETKKQPESALFPTPHEIDEEFFVGAREVRCLNTPEQLVEPAQLLLAISGQCIFVDPYFNLSQNRYLAVLKEFVRSAATSGKCLHFTIFAAQERVSGYKEDFLVNTLNRTITPVLEGKNVQINYYLIEVSNDHLGFHARYLLTEKAGLRYDKGFGADKQPQLVDISILDKGLHNDLYAIYQEKSKQLEIRQTFYWSN